MGRVVVLEEEQMSNWTDFLDTIGDFNTLGENQASETFGAIFGAAADLSGGIGLVQLGFSVAESLLSQDDELQSILNAIQAEFNQLQGQIAAADKLQRMRDIDSGINPAVGVFQQLPAMLAATPPPSTDFKLSQIQICVDAVNFFADYDDKWQVVAADMPYYSDSWSGTVAPKAGSDGLVFNYTYTLPQFIRAIYFLLAAIAALAPTSLHLYTEVLTNALRRLQSVHQTIVSGIVPYREPSSENVGTIYYLEPVEGYARLFWFPNGSQDNDSVQYTLGSYGLGSDGDPDSSFVYNDYVAAGIAGAGWVKVPSSNSAQDGITWPYGAVEIYSGKSNISSYSSDYFPRSQVDVAFWPQTARENFFCLLNLRTHVKMRSLYVSLGMPSVWQTIDHLLQLTGQPVPTAPLYSAWPFTDVIGFLGLKLSPPPGHHVPIESPFQEPAGFEDALKAFLQATPPYVGFLAFNKNANSGPQVPVPVLPSGLPPSFDWSQATVLVSSSPLPTGSLYTFLTGVSLRPVARP
jgi:hypothetical protein